MRRSLSRVVLGSTVAAAAAGFLAVGTARLAVATPGEETPGDAVTEFLVRHWARPLGPQGPPPARFSAVEASLQPEACGTCHPAQLADWQTSLHAATMGPGVAGQLVEMQESDPASAMSCYGCHAPLAEQAPLVRTGDGFRPNPSLDPALRARGLACAACHVRRHERFGPPRRDGSLVGPAPRETLPHNGATRTAAFLRSEFCASCHQFAADGLALNGKLIQDTLAEWRASPFARQGVECQDCHMPERRHLWRGVHDPAMVRSGLDITAESGSGPVRPGETFAARLRVTSRRVGHRFPTYVIPRVVLRAELVGPDGRPLPGSRAEHGIERAVTLDLAREVRDTRLGPGESAVLEFRRRADRPGLRARLTVVVEPDAFYTRFYEALLEQGAGRGAPQIREALAATRRSVFILFEEELPAS